MNKSYVFVLSFASLVFLGACKNDASTTNEANTLQSLSETSEPAKANELLKTLNKEISEIKNDDKESFRLISKGLEISRKFNLKNRTAGYLTMLLRSHRSKLESKEDALWELANIMQASKRTQPANILYRALVDQYPNYKHVESAKGILGDFAGANLNDFILSAGKAAFEEPDFFGMNRSNSLEYVNLCEAYALGFADEESPNYLYKAAEVARSIQTFPKTLSLYDWIYEQYPTNDKASTSLFLKGFIIDNELKNEELARTVYQEFLEKFPEDDLADDVKFLLDNLGKTNEEILDIIEGEKGSKQKPAN